MFLANRLQHLQLEDHILVSELTLLLGYRYKLHFDLLRLTAERLEHSLIVRPHTTAFAHEPCIILRVLSVPGNPCGFQ